MNPSEPSAPFDAMFVALQEALAGRYSLQRELGRGGMGVVYLAHDVQLDRPVAIKVLPDFLAALPDLRGRFLREARTAARLSHPNIVPIHAVTEMGALVYFAMAYVEGETLQQRISAKRILPIPDVVRIVREVAWALGHAHMHGVVHRDIKPDNIMIESGSGRVMVMDFGIAQRDDGAPQTSTGLLLGTAHYMSPEQASGEPVDGRSDIYSLGVTAFYAATGRRPFEGTSAQALLAQHITSDPPDIATARPGIPATLAETITRCLQKNPASRFATASDLAEALGNTAANVDRIAQPVTLWMRGSEALNVGFLFATVTAFGLVMAFPEYQIALMGLPIVYAEGSRLLATRRLFAQGYDLHDIRRAFRTLETQGRENAVQPQQHPQSVRHLRSVTQGGVLLTLLGVFGWFLIDMATAMWITEPDLPGVFHTPAYHAAADAFDAFFAIVWPMTKFSLAAGPLITIASIAAAELISPSHVLSRWGAAADRWRARFWQSWGGAIVTRLASFGVKRRSSAAVEASRPTEIALGAAAIAVYDALPPGTRRQLQDVPILLERIRKHAAAHRARMDELDRLLATARRESQSAHGSVDPENRQRLVSELTNARQQVEARFLSIITALESIRLDLMRVHAGICAPATITADVEAVLRLAESIDAANAQPSGEKSPGQ